MRKGSIISISLAIFRRAVIQIVGLSVILSACRSQISRVARMRTPVSALTPQEASETVLTLLNNDDIQTRPLVESSTIDHAMFRINALRLNKQSYLAHETIIMTFELPMLADYVEILRCRSDSIVYGGEDHIDHIETSSPSLEAASKIYESNDFWEAALSIGNCELVATSYRDFTYEDASAPTGQWRYLVRACVDDERLRGSTRINCSRQVIQTVAITHKNERSLKALKEMARAQNLRNEIDGFSRQIVHRTQDLQKLLFACQQHQQVQVATLDQRNAMATVVGIGTGIGLGATAVGAFAIRRSTSHRTTSTSPPSGAVATTYKALGGISMIGTAAYVTALVYKLAADPPAGFPVDPVQCQEDGALQDLTEQLDDDQAGLCSCTGALDLKIQLRRLTGELEYRLRLHDVRLKEASSLPSSQETDENSDDLDEPEDITKR